MLQKCFVLSTIAVEFITTTENCKGVLWVKRFLNELGYLQDRYVVYCDNQSIV